MFDSLFRSIGTVFRMGKEFVSRMLTRVWAAVRSALSLTTQAAKLIPKALSSLTAAGKKPTKRADYVETRRLFISKSFIIFLILGIAAAAALIYFVVWPWLLSTFFVVKMPISDERTSSYTGRVEIFYDDEMRETMFEGRLEKGIRQGEGKLYYKDGHLQYTGPFKDGRYDGDGQYYSREGLPVYKGSFAQGLYEGKGVEYHDSYIEYEGQFKAGLREGTGAEYSASGRTVYEGQYSAGKRSGMGMLYNSEGTLIYTGGFAAGLREGTGKLYDEFGMLKYAGDFSADKPDGEGTLYYDDGTPKYKGAYASGMLEGDGTLYNEDGSVHYKGGFSKNKYDGEGTLYFSETQWKQGSFEAGVLSGDMKWFKNGFIYYEGASSAGLPQGQGKLYNSRGKVIFDGLMSGGEIDFAQLAGMSAQDLRTAFAEALFTETSLADGFVIVNKEIGVTAFCSYMTESSDPTVLRVYAYAGETYGYTPGKTSAGFAWPEDSQSAKVTQNKKPDVGAGVPLSSSLIYIAETKGYETYLLTIWSKTAGGALFAAEWSARTAAPAQETEKTEDTAAASDARLLDLLKDLGLAA